MANDMKIPIEVELDFEECGDRIVGGAPSGAGSATRHSRYFNEVKEYFDYGLYRRVHVLSFVSHGLITKDEYMEITGEECPDEN